MNQSMLKKIDLNEVCLVELLQLNKKEDMLAIAKKNGAEVKKSHTKAKIAEELTKHMKETFLEQLSFLRTRTWDTFNALVSKRKIHSTQVSNKERIDLKDLEREGYLFITKENDENLTISLAQELVVLVDELNSDPLKRKKVENNQKLIDYTLALTHLYGVYPMEQLMKIWNIYQIDQIDQESLSEKLTLMETKQPSFKWNRSLIYAQSFLKEEDAVAFYEAVQSLTIPYFTPTENELALYVDVLINRKTPFYLNIQNFVQIKTKTNESAAKTMSEITESTILGTQPKEVYESLSKKGLLCLTGEDVGNFIQLFQELSNQTKTWNFRGWTPDEAMSLLEKAPMKKAPILVNKVGRNERCPCGSGKKYKKCHGL